MGKVLVRIWIIGVLIFMMVSSALALPHLRGVRYWSAPDHTRVVLDVSGSGKAKVYKLLNPPRVVVDIKGLIGLPSGKKIVGDGVIREIRWAPKGTGVRVVLVLEKDLTYSFFYLKPFRSVGARYVLDVQKPKSVVAKERMERIQEAEKEKRERHFIVVVDPGHGGDDPGAVHNGLMEKRVVFSIAKKLVDLLNSTPGFRGYLTRKGDYYLPLRKRVEIAHEYKADLFISIHCNAAPSRRAKGVMVFALSSRGATDNVSRMLARIENTADLMEVSFSKKREINYILLDMAQDYSRLESEKFARLALRSLVRHTGLRRGGVRRARFIVLQNPGIPSVLVEVGFLTNPKEARLLRSASFRTRVAEALLDAVKDYFKGKRKAPPPKAIVASAKSHKGMAHSKKRGHRKRWLVHVVKKGDTLWELSRRYGVKVKTIITVNGLRKSVIYPGQRLVFPVGVTSL